MGSNRAIGMLGEQAAASYLEQKGHKIVTLNFRFERREVDIISVDKNVLVFTEVKTRANFDFGYPEAAISTKKQEHIKSVAMAFLLDNPSFEQIRFDIISILVNKGKIVEIVHFEDAFY
jgi:putative endonuclease